MTLIALDPGPTETGFVLYDGAKVRDAGVLRNEQVLLMLRQDWRQRADELVMEMIASYGMPVGREVFDTCVWIGRFTEAWRSPDAVRLVFRKDVKLHLCGTTKAKDPNVWHALLDRFGGEAAVGRKASPGPLYGVKSHARAALAVAVTAWETEAA